MGFRLSSGVEIQTLYTPSSRNSNLTRIAEIRTADATDILQRERRHELPTARCICKSFGGTAINDAKIETPAARNCSGRDDVHAENRVHVHGFRRVRHPFQHG